MFTHILKFLIFSIFTYSFSYASNLAIEDIIVKSDNLTVNKKEGKAYFTGSVRVWFDEAVLKTSEIIIILKDETNNKKREIDRIIFPSRITAMHLKSNEVIIADKGEYIADKNLLNFKGNIYMQKDEHKIKCNELNYLLKLKSIRNIKDKSNE